MFSDATTDDLVSLVKFCNKHDIPGKNGLWPKFIRAHSRYMDPKKHSRKLLEAFAADLMAEDDDDEDEDEEEEEEAPQADGAGAAAGGESGAAGESPATAPPAPKRAFKRSAAAAARAREVVPRYLKWIRRARKDAANRLGEVPPPQPGEPDFATTGQQLQQQPQQKQQQKQKGGEEGKEKEKERPAAAQAQAQAPPMDSQQVSVWSLVRRTRANSRYDTLFGHLPSYDVGWVRAKRSQLSADVRPRLLALDCEMCSTETDDAALLGVCVVDEFGAVVYRELVRPEGVIKDLRTQLTGVTEADLEGVTVTARDAQKAVRKLLEGGGEGGDGRPVVLVGHSLHHDLTALRIDFQPVIDTALMYSFRGLPACTPGLKDLAKVFLDLDMRRGEGGAHDSREDASVTMRIVMRELQMAAPSFQVDAPQIQVPPSEQAKLLVHSLPEGAGEEQLRAAFEAADAPAFERVEHSVDGSKKFRKQMILVFKHAGVSHTAFLKLPGRASSDSMGRKFKVLNLGPGTGNNCKVRKMAGHNGMLYTPFTRLLKEENKSPAGGGAKKQTAGAKKQTAGKKRPRSPGGGGGGGGGGPSPGPTGAAAAAKPAEAGAGAAAANGSERKAKKQKREEHGGGGGGGGGDPVKEAGKRPRVADGAGADAQAAAPKPVPEPAAAAAAVETDSQPPSQAKRKRRRKSGQNGQAAAPAAATAAAPAAATVTAPVTAPPGTAAAAAEEADGAKRSKKGKERKRKRGETEAAEEGGEGGGEGEEGAVRKKGKKARKASSSD
ncbi:hypothetical protein PLESTF_000408700 [Pleodorina starrii]|nr:hypothetical protein PLESTM_001450200 [Pleodorina starrii]GLC66296.1 hypothetical protein PLESTF_000408700 [Pleodorina starrii]